MNGIWSQTQDRFSVVPSKANRYFLFHLGMQTAGKSNTFILTNNNSNNTRTHTHTPTTNPHFLFTVSER